MRLDQSNQTLPGHDLIHLDQETLAAGLLTFASVLGIREGHLFHRAQPFNSCEADIAPNLEVFFRVSLEVPVMMKSSAYLTTCILNV
jgi:hypothetical protein